jgi:hypothetical protein
MTERVTQPQDSRISQYTPSNEAVFLALLPHAPQMYMVYRQCEHVARHGDTYTVAELAATMHVSPRSVSFCLRALRELGLIETITTKDRKHSFVSIAFPAPDDVLEALGNGTISFDWKTRQVLGYGRPRHDLAASVSTSAASVSTSETPKPNDSKQLTILDQPETGEGTFSALSVVSITSNDLKIKSIASNTRESAPKIGRPKADWSADPDQPAILEIFKYWQDTFGFHERSLTAERRKYLKTLIGRKYPLDRMKRAIDNTRASAWQMGDNDRNQPYNDVEHIFRNEARADQRAAMVPRPGASVTKSPFHPSTRDMTNPNKQQGGRRF